jgi:acyl-CoA thioesterase-2
VAVNQTVEAVRELVAVTQPRQVDDGTFVAEAPNWMEDRVFGGLIVAQALNAAVQTVEDRPLPNSFHGYFLRPARADAEIHFRVQRLLDGRTLRVRQATVSQTAKPIFIMACSFHDAGDHRATDQEQAEYQPPMPSGLPAPEDLPPVESSGPFDVREIEFVAGVTRRVWIRVAERVRDDRVVHATLLAYLSGMSDTEASIDHAIWFHRWTRADEWLCYDLHTASSIGGRRVVRGAMYDRDGVLCLSTAQEFVIRTP